ncbi:MAG: hypothetical protein AB8B77_03060 [Alphaproteobacteria bacterium]
MLKDKIKVEAYFTEDERDWLNEQSAKLHISRAEMVRRMALGSPLPAFGKQEAVLDLLKINANLARLGNLLKLALDNAESDNLSINLLKIDQTIVDLANTQSTLKQKIKEL